MATTEPCCGFPNSTHYAGCTCHENGWAMRLAAAEAERDRLQEKLDQFDAHGMPNVASALDRVNAAEARALCLEGERDAWQRSAEIVEAALAEARITIRDQTEELFVVTEANKSFGDGHSAILHRAQEAEHDRTVLRDAQAEAPSPPQKVPFWPIVDLDALIAERDALAARLAIAEAAALPVFSRRMLEARLAEATGVLNLAGAAPVVKESLTTAPMPAPVAPGSGVKP